MKKFIFILFLFCLALSASGQRLNYVNSYGMQFKRLGADSLSFMPADTFAVPAAYVGKRFTAVKGGVLYYWNGSAWTAATASVPTLQQVVTAGNTSDKAIEFTSENSLNNGLRFNGNYRWAYKDTSRPAFMFGTADADIPAILQGFSNEIELNDGSIYYRAAGAGKHIFDDTIFIEAASGASTDSLLTWNAASQRVGRRPATTITSDILYSIDLTGGADTLTVPGFYVIETGTPLPGTTEMLSFPDPALWSGYTITIINKDAVWDAVLDLYKPKEPTNTTSFNNIKAGHSYIFKSDGTNWYCVSRYTGITD